MKAIWSGSLRLVLLNIPVNCYSASKERVFNFDLFHKKDLSPIRYAKVCKKEEKEVEYEEIVKGFEYEKDKFVILNEEDFEKANIEKTKTISILGFTTPQEIEMILFEKPFYLEPQEGAEKSYLLLREALKKSEKIGICKFVLRNREHLGVLIGKDNLIILNQIRFLDEIEAPKDLKLPKGELIAKNEIEIALDLIKKMTITFKPETYQDEYSQDLERVIKEKATGKTPTIKGKIPEPTAVPDLMKMLKESLKEDLQKTKG